MSRGPGRVQNGCLSAIAICERKGGKGELPTTYDIVAHVYRLTRDEDSNYWITDAQHVAVKRALANLQRKGRVIGFRMPWQPGDHYRQRHFCWMSEKRAQQWMRDNKKEKPVWVDHVREKMQAIGMEVR